MGLARKELSETPDIGFWKLCGSGTGEGFTPRPNTAVYAILATWPDLATAQARTVDGPVHARHAAHAVEDWHMFLRPISARGAWSRAAPFAPSDDPGSGPIAALTRATVRPHRAAQF